MPFMPWLADYDILIYSKPKMSEKPFTPLCPTYFIFSILTSNWWADCCHVYYMYTSCTIIHDWILYQLVITTLKSTWFFGKKKTFFFSLAATVIFHSLLRCTYTKVLKWEPGKLSWRGCVPLRLNFSSDYMLEYWRLLVERWRFNDIHRFLVVQKYSLSNL